MAHRGVAAATVAVLAALVAPCDAAQTDEGDLASLLDGVARVSAPGVPGPLCVFGQRAFAVVTGQSDGAVRQPVVAAARLGKGRIVAFGHPGYFDKGALEAGDTTRLVANAVRWAAGAPPAGSPGPEVAVHRHGGQLAALRKLEVAAAPLEGSGWLAKLPPFRVLCINPNSLRTRAAEQAVATFVRDGGGLLVADLGWGWLQLHPGRTLLADHPGNRLLAPAGLVWADGYLKRTCDVGYATEPTPPKLCHAAAALVALEAHASGKSRLASHDSAQAARTVLAAAQAVPPADKLLRPRLQRLREAHGAKAVPTPKKPLTSKQPLARLVMALDVQDMKARPPDKTQAHPAAAAFPGAVPADAKRVEQTVEIDTAVPNWHSTGLYAAPGEVVTVRVPQAAAGKKLAVRIGAHSDRLWHHNAWRRCPDVCRRFPIAGTATRAANAFGGPVYIEVPGGCRLGRVPVTIAGAVEAPHYVLGKTPLDAWRKTLRHRPAPWAELAGKRVVLTVPARVVRGLDDPETLMKFWDAVLDACAELAARPLERTRPERYVTDTQISAGYMHSGYPIMTLLDVAPVLVDKARMMRNGHGGVWGLFHEMGHNHQSGDWTFGGTVEVTVNLFTLYVFEKVCGSPKGSFDRVGGPRRERMLKKYFAGGVDFEKQWTRSPFLALVMYVQLQEAFGWDAFKKVFAEYRRLPRGQRPRGDAQKRDQWMVRFSRAVGRDLGPFFQAWGVPVSAQARASIAALPKWMPEGFPPK